MQQVHTQQRMSAVLYLHAVQPVWYTVLLPRTAMLQNTLATQQCQVSSCETKRSFSHLASPDPCRSTFENNVAVQYAALVSHFTSKARSAVKIVSKNDPENELQFIRIRSKKHEIMIAPDFDKAHDYQLIVVQNSSTD